MAKLAAGLLAGLALLVIVIGAAVGGATSIFSSDGNNTAPSQTAIDDIPGDYLALYLHAARTCPGLDWSILAAIGKVESDHGRSQLPGVHIGANPAGAQGPMQFLPATFAAHSDAIPPGGSNPPSPFDPHDAIHTAANYLCATGARHDHDLHGAIFAYNRADWYVATVLTHADTYASTDPGGDAAPGSVALQAINYAQGQLGLPYLWGGDGPNAGDAGFDCSGLTHAAYTAAGITLPRTAHTQYHAGPHIPSGEPLQPGDLVFYGTPTRVHHVGLYIGHNQMIHAPRRGDVIKIAPYRWDGDDYLGATRPMNRKATGRISEPEREVTRAGALHLAGTARGRIAADRRRRGAYRHLGRLAGPDQNKCGNLPYVGIAPREPQSRDGQPSSRSTRTRNLQPLPGHRLDAGPGSSSRKLTFELILPLNLDQNQHSGFHRVLSSARDAQRRTARRLPPLP